MKKLLTLIAVLLMGCIGAMAETTTATYGKGNGTFYNADGTAVTGGFVAKTFVSNTTPAVTLTCSYGTGLNQGDAVNGARLGTDGTNAVTTYTLSVPDGYVITGYELEAWAVNTSHPAKTFTTEDGTTYDVSTTTKQNVSVTGLDTQSTYFTITLNAPGWSPIKTNNFKIYVEEKVGYHIFYNCYDEEDHFLESVKSEETYEDGATVDVSGFTHDIVGYTLKSITPTSVTISGANAEVKVVYALASSFDYTLALTGDVPEGTVVTINGEAKTDGASVSSATALTESDITVTFPSEYSYMAYTVTISGATVTVDCYDPRWPVNFPKDQTFTRSDRHINSVTFEDGLTNPTIDDLYVDASTTCYQDLTATKTVTLASEISVHPSFSILGAWQHGFVYIDLNNDGDFTDDGELVSKINAGNPNLATDMPNFTTPAEGTYRMRVKTDWASEDPGGNEGAEPGNINGNNHIIKNGGQIVDVTLEVKDAYGDDALYEVLIGQLEAINWGLGLNQYSLTGELADFAGNEKALIAQKKEEGYSAENQDTLQLMLANYALNMPGAGFYRIQGQTSQKFLAAGLAANNKFNMSDATDASTVFYFDGTTLTNLGSGMCNGMLSKAWAWVTGDNASIVTFQDGLTNGGYAIRSSLAEDANGANFYDNGDGTNSADRGASVTINSATNARYTSWYLTAVDELPITLSALGYTTLYSPVALAVPDGITAYKAADNGDYLELTAVAAKADDVIPALTGVILAGNEGSYTFALATAEDAVADNALTGSLTALARPAYSYVLGTRVDEETLTEVACFNVDGDTTIPGFRAYLQAADDSQPVKSFHIDIVDGIRSMDNGTMAHAAVYNLAGQKVNGKGSKGTLPKGVYIVNGKAVVIK